MRSLGENVTKHDEIRVFINKKPRRFLEQARLHRFGGDIGGGRANLPWQEIYPWGPPPPPPPPSLRLGRAQKLGELLGSRLSWSALMLGAHSRDGPWGCRVYHAAGSRLWLASVPNMKLHFFYLFQSRDMKWQGSRAVHQTLLGPSISRDNNI